MDFKFFSPFSILFFEGLTSFIVISLLFFPLSKIDCTQSGVFCQIVDEEKVQKVEDFFETFKIITSDYEIVLMAITYMISYFFIISSVFTQTKPFHPVIEV